MKSPRLKNQRFNFTIIKTSRKHKLNYSTVKRTSD